MTDSIHSGLSISGHYKDPSFCSGSLQGTEDGDTETDNVRQDVIMDSKKQ